MFQNALGTATIDVDIPGSTGGGTTLTTSRHCNTVDDLRNQIVEARIYGGLHCRARSWQGSVGRQVAQSGTQRYFQPAR